MSSSHKRGHGHTSNYRGTLVLKRSPNSPEAGEADSLPQEGRPCLLPQLLHYHDHFLRDYLRPQKGAADGQLDVGEGVAGAPCGATCGGGLAQLLGRQQSYEAQP